MRRSGVMTIAPAVQSANKSRRRRKCWHLERREERREGPGGGGDNRYQMTQRMLSIGDDFWIENEMG